MSVPFSAVVTPDSLIFSGPDGKTHSITADHDGFEKAKKLIKLCQSHRKTGDDMKADYLVDQLIALVTPARVIEDKSGGAVVVRDGIVYYEGEAIHSALTNRIVWGLSEGFDMDPYIAFLQRVMANPSKRAVDELYTFVERSKMGITEDGHILAYKRVRADFRDIHSGQFDNSPGKIVTMARNKVNDNPNETCSAGLHVCSMSYLPHYGAGAGNIILIVKVDPADVVSVPVDYEAAKMRTCRYEVLGTYDGSDKDDLLATKAVWRDREFGSRASESGQQTTDNGEFSVGDLVVCVSDENMESSRIAVGDIRRVFSIEGDNLIFYNDNSFAAYPSDNFDVHTEDDEDDEDEDETDDDALDEDQFISSDACIAALSGQPAPQVEIDPQSDGRAYADGMKGGYAAGKQAYIVSATEGTDPLTFSGVQSGFEMFDNGYAYGWNTAMQHGSDGIFVREIDARRIALVQAPTATAEPVVDMASERYDAGSDAGYAAGKAAYIAVSNSEVAEEMGPMPTEDVAYDAGFLDGFTGAIGEGATGAFDDEIKSTPIADPDYAVGQRVIYKDGSFKQYVVIKVTDTSLDTLPLRGGAGLVSAKANWEPASAPIFAKGDRVIDRRIAPPGSPVYRVIAVTGNMVELEPLDHSTDTFVDYPELYEAAPEPAAEATDAPSKTAETEAQPLPAKPPTRPPERPAPVSGIDMSRLMGAVRQAATPMRGEFSSFTNRGPRVG